jgi:hypothetical protein
MHSSSRVSHSILIPDKNPVLLKKVFSLIILATSNISDISLTLATQMMTYMYLAQHKHFPQKSTEGLTGIIHYETDG